MHQYHFVFGLQNQTYIISPEPNSNIGENDENNNENNNDRNHIIFIRCVQTNYTLSKTKSKLTRLVTLLYQIIHNFPPIFGKMNELIQSYDGMPIPMTIVTDGRMVLMFGLTDHDVTFF